MKVTGNREQGIGNRDFGLWALDSRRGITLLEVLISIGVLSVGIMGAASLLPMASYFQNETTKYDRGGALAQQAAHDLQIKNYLSPRRWIFLDPGSPNVTNPLGVAQLAALGSYNPFSAVVLDPLGFSYVAEQKRAVPAAQFPCYFPAFPNQFPNPPGTNTVIPNFPPTIYRAGVTANDYWPPAATTQLFNPIIMPFSVADRLFRSGDDLIFDAPADGDFRPHSVSGTYMPSFNGDFSWIATVSRTPTDMSSAAAAQTHRFQVSVVVLQKRNLSLWADALDGEQPPPERQVYAMFTQYGGQPTLTAPFQGGGGLQLYVYESGSNPLPGEASRHWLDNIKSNTYLMLSANFFDSLGTTNGALYPKLGWYRILSVDDGPNQDTSYSSGPSGPTTTRWYRNVTVTGEDWPAMNYLWPPVTGTSVPNWQAADPSAPSGASSPVAYCTLMDDAVAVYDETITLDYSLLRQ